ncbi:MAG TPA: hypothetical protein PLQ80_05800 [Candidatus Syntrophosphaera sp.]|nr:hypothetical protein [Candidatus Syntrophosphaera sp.]HPH60003.1 hypothetical protein [Candidatus Syntrophosphaera sp.]
MRGLILACICLVALPLGALIPQNTASANALAGITLLSQSVADFQLSPALPFTGIAASGHLPFSAPEAGTFSLSAAHKLSFLVLNAGASHSGDADYSLQDFRLGLGINLGGLSAGYAQHLILESASTGSYQSWCGDAVLAYRSPGYGYEARLLRIGREDTELHLSVSTAIVQGIEAATSYVYTPAGPDGYRLATSIEVTDNLLLQSSWQSSPNRFGAGLRFQLKGWDLMYAVRTHPDLRLSHSLDLGYSW